MNVISSTFNLPEAKVELTLADAWDCLALPPRRQISIFFRVRDEMSQPFVSPLPHRSPGRRVTSDMQSFRIACL